MPVVGRKPKASGNVRHRVKPAYEWTEVPDLPYDGDVPNLPRRSRGSWSAATKRWWATVSVMPHCRLWAPSDWQFALDTAAVYEEFNDSPSKNSKALLDREKILGTTTDYRRDLRIRYIDAADDEIAEVDISEVAILEQYRRVADQAG